MRFRIIVGLSISLSLTSCGGGGGGEGGTDAPSTNVLSGGKLTLSAECRKTMHVRSGYLGYVDPTGGSGGVGGVGSEGASDGGGTLGQFRNTLVVVRNQNLEEIGRAYTDNDRGMISIGIGNCRDPIEVEYVGGGDATYFDEATRTSEPFPEGQRLRARYPSLPKAFGVTPYTEAAVRLMDSGPGGPLTSLDAGTVHRANTRISEMLTDLVPGPFREGDDGTRSLIDITRYPDTLNARNVSTPGTLTNTAAGRYGAVVAGFGVASGTFLGAGSSVAAGVGLKATKAGPNVALSPALRATEQLVEDLSDGQLDLQGPKGPVAPADQLPAYTYETLWRAKTIGAGLASGDAGDAGLLRSLNDVKVAEYVFTFASTRLTPTCRGEGCIRFEARSTGGQTVRLFSDGRLTIQRGTSSAFGSVRRYVDVETAAEGVEVKVRDPQTGRDLRFVDVKVGTRGEIIALQQDRRGFVYIRPMALYEVQGDEDPQAVDESLLRPLLEIAPVQIKPGNAATLSIVNFTPSPADRTFPGLAKPDFIYLLADGGLWGASIASPNVPVKLPQPKSLQSVVYDKFVPPGFDPAYGGVAPPGGVQLPWAGPRRLYGLTREGEVVTWLEGESATGVGLALPGKVKLLAAESKSAVYALTSEGKVYWLNADQSRLGTNGAGGGGAPPSLDVSPRFPLHHVEQVKGLDKAVCWLARTEAIACGSGEVYRWTEDLTRLTYGDQDRDSTFIPVGVGKTAAKVDGITPMWRISAVEAFYRRSLEGQALFIEGSRLLTVDGIATSLEAALGQRNLLISDPQKGRHLDGTQYRKALESVFNANSPLAQGLERMSSDGRTLRFSVVPRSANEYFVSMPVDEDTVPEHPPVEMTVAFESSGTAVDRFEILSLRGGDLNIAESTSKPTNAPARFGDADAFPLDQTSWAWQLTYADPVSRSNTILRLKVVPMPILSRPYEFRICFYVEGQAAPPLSLRFERTACTHHANDGAFLNKISGGSLFVRHANGAPFPPDNLFRTDFGQLYEFD